MRRMTPLARLALLVCAAVFAAGACAPGQGPGGQGPGGQGPGGPGPGGQGPGGQGPGGQGPANPGPPAPDRGGPDRAAAPQAPVEPDGLPLVLAPSPTARHYAMRSFSTGLTVDAGGRHWCLVLEVSTVERARSLVLCRSDDGGASWRRVAATPTAWSEFGAIQGEPTADVLHVAWAGRVGDDGFTSALYQRFDAAAGTFVGEPEVLQRGSGSQDQFGVADLGVATDRTVAVVVTTHRQPKQPPWPSGWSSGLMVRRAHGREWRGPLPLHTHRYGVWTNLQVHDGRAHATFRTSPSHSMIGYRSLALSDLGFEQDEEHEVSVRPDSGLRVANASSLLVGPFGERTVLYPAGADDRGGKGRLLVAHAAPGEPWRTEVLVDDPPLAVGNVAQEHFALVRRPGRQAIALYSKVRERHRVLYRRVLEQGRPMEPERAIARSELPDAYVRVSAMRDPRLDGPLWALVSGDGAGAALGVRAVRAPGTFTARWR